MTVSEEVFPVSRIPARLHSQETLSLPARRTALLERIHAAREATVVAGRRVAVDLHATERTRLSIITGLKVLKASVVAAGVIWSFNTISHNPRMGRSRRYLTMAVSLLSSIRAMRKIGALVIPLLQTRRS